MTTKDEMNQAEYMSQLKNLVEECMSPEPIFDKDGNSTGFFKMRDPEGAVKALEMLGRSIGMFSK